MMAERAAPPGHDYHFECHERAYQRRMNCMEKDSSKENEFQTPREKRYPDMKKAQLTPSRVRQRAPRVRQRASKHGFLLLLLLAFIMDTSEGAGPYGTDNGYDNEGGTEPICWDSQVRWEISRFPPNTTAEADDNFDTMNSKLFANTSTKDEVDVTLRKSCYEGMNLTVTPNNPNFNGRLLTGQEHSFRFDFKFVPSQVDEDAFLATNTNNNTWIRLLLCDAIRTGFCSPFLEQGDIDTSEETDLSGPMVNEETGQVDRYGMEEDRILKGVTDGLHLFTRFARWGMTEVEEGVFNVTLDIGFQVPEGQGGYYFFIGHAVVYFDVSNNTTPYLFRIDIADAVPTNVVEFFEPAQINTISNEFKIAVAVVCGIFFAMECVLLYGIFYYRKNSIMTLAQAPFLGLLTVCGMIVTATAFVFMPTRDIYCNLHGVLIILPLTLMASILVGRLWRVYSTLRIALSIGDKHEKRQHGLGGQRLMDFLSCLASLHTLFKGEYVGSRRSSLRRQVSDADLLRVLFLLTLPQLILQILGVSLYQREITIVFNDDGDVGRPVCDLATRWPILAGEIYIGLLFVMAIIAAYTSRELPSIFNEKNAIFMTASMNGVVLFFVLSMIFIFERSILDPNVTAFLWIFMTLFLVVSMLCMIVAPKVKRATSGEKIVMSKLLDPNLSRRHSSIALRRATSMNGVVANEDRGPMSPEGAISASEQTAIANASARFRANAIVLNIDDPPPRRIERQMFFLKDLISEFTNNSLEGRHISLSLWNALIAAIDGLQSDLDSMNFTWSEGDELQLVASGSSM